MAAKNQQDWQERLEELEAEVNAEDIPFTPTEKITTEEKVTAWLTPLRNWFDKLPRPGKVIVIVGGGLIAFSILNTVLRLVASLISLAVLAVIVYFAYRFLINNKSD